MSLRQPIIATTPNSAPVDSIASVDVSGHICVELTVGYDAPSDAEGADGNFYLRGGGSGATNTVLYHKEAGHWVGLSTAPVILGSMG